MTVGTMSDFETRAMKSGRLAESFIERKFGVVEDDKFEVKSTSSRNNQVVLRVIQLINSIGKQYIAVRYNREMKTISRGPNKGKRVHSETIDKAFRRKLDVFVMRGVELLKVIERETIPLRSIDYQKQANWAAYWCVPIRYFPTNVVFEDDEVTVYGNPIDPPEFLNVDFVRCDDEEEVPF